MNLIVPAWLTGVYGKVIGAVAITLLMGWGARLWLNAHDDRVAARARNNTIIDMKKAYEKDWSKELNTIHVEVRASQDAIKPLVTHMYQQDAAIANLFGKLNKIETDIKERQVVYVQQAAAVAPTQLDGAIRAVSERIAARESPK